MLMISKYGDVVDVYDITKDIDGFTPVEEGYWSTFEESTVIDVECSGPNYFKLKGKSLKPYDSLIALDPDGWRIELVFADGRVVKHNGISDENVILFLRTTLEEAGCNEPVNFYSIRDEVNHLRKRFASYCKNCCEAMRILQEAFGPTNVDPEFWDTLGVPGMGHEDDGTRIPISLTVFDLKAIKNILKG